MLSSILIAALLLATPRPPEATPSELVVMSFNLRYASEEGENRWSQRREALAATIRGEKPDVVGTQEGLYHQLEDIERDLPDYTYVGLGRRGGSHDEYCAIFYRKERFEVTAYDHFWLSDRPREIGALSYDATLPRMVTWARLRERATERAYYVVNTHFDHAHEISREKSANQLHAFVRTLETKDPVIVTGDFNAAAGSTTPWRTLTQDGALIDSFVEAGFADPQPGTFHGFTGDASVRGRIDWILYRGNLTPKAPRIVRPAAGGIYPSDHFPVIVSFSTRE